MKKQNFIKIKNKNKNSQMAATMTATGAAEEIWFVAQITARSLVTTIMKRTIAARNHDQKEFLMREDSESLLRNV